MQNQIRIIAGKWRGRKISFPADSQVRPTLDRRREQLFSWIGPYVVGANCLDICAGTGALSFEALSRGAQSATLIEPDPILGQNIETNRDKLGASALKLFETPFSTQASSLKQMSFDLIFCDPPFTQPALINQCLDWLEDYMANRACWVYLELPTTAAARISALSHCTIHKQIISKQYALFLLKST